MHWHGTFTVAGLELAQVPIVINAIRVGDPLRPSKMRIKVLPEQAGRRWQYIPETEVRRWHGKHIVFEGLSNAALAMLAQI